MPDPTTDTTETQNSTSQTAPDPASSPPTQAPSADGGDTTLLGGAGADQDANEAAAAPPPAPGSEEAPPTGVPETYDLKLTTKAEDGTEETVAIDPVLMQAATPVLKELGLSNDQANRLAPLAIDIQQRVLDLQAEDFEATKAKWSQMTKADPEMGGRNWAETESLVARALDTFGATKGSEFRGLLDDSGLGNHPVVVRLFREIGKRLGEAGMPPSSLPPAKPKSREEILYPDDVPAKQGVS